MPGANFSVDGTPLTPVQFLLVYSTLMIMENGLVVDSQSGTAQQEW